jgi:hypothetical protein
MGSPWGIAAKTGGLSLTVHHNGKRRERALGRFVEWGHTGVTFGQSRPSVSSD